MTIFELVRQEVTARQAAELYGLRFERNGRAFCPFHNDGAHAAMAFDKNGWCHCFVCNQNWDTVSLVAQMLGLSEKAAAERIRQDFKLDMPVDNRPAPSTKLKAQQRRDAKEELNRRWGYLCDVVREADARLAKYTPETIDAEFDVILAARCRADTELNLLWEEICNGRA